MLRMTFVAASSNSPKCSMATKKANHEATLIYYIRILLTNVTVIANLKVYFYFFNNFCHSIMCIFPKSRR